MENYATVKLDIDVLRRWLQFSKHDLDDQFLVIPMQLYRLSTEVAYAIAERDKAKQTVELKKADFDSEVRKNPKKYNLLKGTETEINAVVSKLLDPWASKLIELQKTLNIIQAGHNAMRDKMMAMTYVYKMYENSYFADGRLPKVAEEAGNARLRQMQQEGLSKIASEPSTPAPVPKLRRR